MGVLTKYGFWLYREIKEIRQKNDGGLTKYGFGFNKEIKGFGEEKSWGLNEVWIWLVWRNKRNWGRKKMGVRQSMDLVLVKK